MHTFLFITEMSRIILGDCTKEINHVEDKSVQTIYIDPPFNSDRQYRLDSKSDVGFTDIWTDETYKVFIDTIITSCIKKLKDNGSLFFHISAEEMFIPECILRQKFKFVSPIFWKRCRSKNNIKKTLGASIDVIFWCYQSQKRKFNMVYQARDEYYVEHSFKNKDGRGNFALGHLVADRTRKGYEYEYEIGGRTFAPKNGLRILKSELELLEKDDRLYVPKTKAANLYKKVYLDECEGKPAMDCWDDIPSIAQGSETRHYPTAKPVKLLERILKMTTDEGDIVLDPTAGSGTTGIACKNLNRCYILIDQNPQSFEIMNERLVSSEAPQPNPVAT